MNDIIEAEEVVAARGVKVVFGAVKALDGADLIICAGECLGLVGHNGAGKSTIVNVINGGLTPHEGSISYRGDQNRHGIAAARANGVRCVFQELSLCPNLTISENVRIMHAAIGGRNWRSRALTTIRQTLDEIFPGHGIDCELTISELSIAERQMVEIAINFCRIPQAPRLVILDEPTSSLDAGLAEQLMEYVRRFVREGGSVLLISHILGEILSTATRIVVMKDGRVVADRKAAEFTTRSLVEAMGSVVKEQDRRQGEGRKAGEKVLSMPARRGEGLAFEAFRGEIIGLAGLGGHGQTEALLDLYLAQNSSWLPSRKTDIAFVAGDRSLNGTFPLWSILKNLSIASLRDISSAGMVDRTREMELGAQWKQRIEIRTPDMGNKILSLSGGNQQKVLFARALATTASTVLMDDPMRGVDIGTKQEVYDILRTEASHGRTFIWYSTEMDEIRLCDRVYVFRDGAIQAELVGDDITEQNVLAASFAGEDHA
ncbi:MULTISPECIES: ATP-binding cassette domain-containing protein [Rhizobium/Agrobacterium group]|uniref:Putative ribose transport ATP-binding protein (RbsA) n=1 Tax=Agrobacterium tomkonis CFBP 6623 TaxID=1183432 RepID=A0A1S7RHD5_9HYPH|nr:MULTISPECIES: sugar ABC transporter ATP-binding protein [Rhizobium/Agrobacterium group]KRA56481.1 ABC transporter ATP-binding protein [Rhizobium sp. Root651]QCL91575.1 sugar ABC transporter ATP-binding protein [Agrobacterium tumefaciens]TKT57196.1 sugar ABC transporter ATP-binding protein [Agrobacterium sp. LC34]CUX52489.1 putative ribose transport ATP-binding protein (rbsA) [Agrobacterium tomkonis CFBP 6623]